MVALWAALGLIAGILGGLVASDGSSSLRAIFVGVSSAVALGLVLKMVGLTFSTPMQYFALFCLSAIIVAISLIGRALQHRSPA